MNKSVLVFTILTLVTIILWVFFSIWNVFTQSQIAPDVEKNVKNNAVTLDTNYLAQIYQNRNK